MATLRYNSETPDNAAHELFEVKIGEVSWQDETPGLDDDEDPYILLDDETMPCVLIAEGADYLGLKPNTVYRLVEVPTELEADGEVVIPDDEPATELN
jgi:hypothetical protein